MRPRLYHYPTLFSIPIVEKTPKELKTPKVIPEKKRKLNRRKHNAAYRLRCKIGEAAFPKKSKNIFCELGDSAIENITEIKILTKEYGFAVKPLAFLNI